MESITIKSSSSDCSLSFYDWDGKYFNVSVKSQDHSANVRVWVYDDSYLPVSLFENMIQKVGGIQNEESWCALEGEFELHGRVDKLGHVFLRVVLNNINMGTSEPWRLEAKIKSEIGQIEKTAKDVAYFFKKKY